MPAPCTLPSACRCTSISNTPCAPPSPPVLQRAIAVYNDPALYAKLRSNAYDSVMDLAVVGLAWYGKRVVPSPCPSQTQLPHSIFSSRVTLVACEKPIDSTCILV
jgi:hypothetical protein